MSVRRPIFRFHHELLLRYGRGVGMGMRDGVETKILTQYIYILGAQGCKTLADGYYFFLVLGEGVEGTFLKECEAANLPFPPRVVTKIWQGCRYGYEG